jgi:pimeloyl-ACP methyl ester carboxylesterase
MGVLFALSLGGQNESALQEDCQMVKPTLINGLNARIAVTRFGAGTPETIVAACGDVSLFETVSFPYSQMDLRGQGQSLIDKNTVDELSLEHYMADFDAVFSQFRGKTKARSRSGATLVGYSQAGFFVTHYAALKPEAVSKLILIEPALYTEREELLKRAEYARRGDATEAVSAMLRYVDPSTAHDLERGQRMMKTVVSNAQSANFIASHYRVRADNPITPRHLRKLTMPVLLIGGTTSHVKDMVSRAACEIENACVWYVPGANHLDLMTSKYSRVLGPILDAFIAS